jgi:hypothetical protein
MVRNTSTAAELQKLYEWKGRRRGKTAAKRIRPLG